ncbi:AbrB/MazE/SpoVT family DNA-binding domain-containing protein [Candidatus Contendibacter odensensis]|uniref:Transcriptional regulator, AbrB family n=1 Tax=Candidatus Contendobacter odensis Run_B_J11 TaxID=1400861 RepID=A0A7U7J5L6_9GAMM|nr:AbrB/MazE/SpoVT family DNA-binding domain-containing protein [Candidatus Contendobacter odensis]CDH47484.1 putative Transcriptional regulator, AbrB family [Candidatus Contendobacter odensis Run_B_J11]
MQTVLSSKGQTVIPKPIREALGIKPGDRINIVLEGNSARLIPIRQRPTSRVADGAGMLYSDQPPAPVDFDAWNCIRLAKIP